MPRKKLKRSSATKTNAKAKIKFQSLTESMEKSFRDIPAQIAVQAQKDIGVLKLQEAKLQSSLQKKQKQQKAVKTKQDNLETREKLTIAAKKQLKVSKKTVDQINKDIAILLKQIEGNKEGVKLLSNKQAKFTALKKQISKLEKEWEQAQAKPKAARKSSAKKTKQVQLETPEVSSNNSVEQPLAAEPLADTTELNS